MHNIYLRNTILRKEGKIPNLQLPLIFDSFRETVTINVDSNIASLEDYLAKAN